MSFRLQGDRVTVLVDKDEETTASGLHIPGGEAKAFKYGTVTAIGPGPVSMYSGEHIPLELAVGDRAFLPPPWTVVHHR